MQEHIPVLLNEVIEFLEPKSGRSYIDATFGGGGHALALLKKTGPTGKVFSVEADMTAISHFRSKNSDREWKNLTLIHGNFRDIENLAHEHGFKKVDGILFDLGFSSIELDNANRGLSFQKDGPLDMRFDQSKGRMASEILNEDKVEELEKIFKEYGEERFSKKIARNIERERKIHPITTTLQLFNIIKSSLPGKFQHKTNDTARRIFQALRIVVNDELSSLRLALPQALSLLSPNGRLAVISFHSLEDRIVKRFFQERAHGCVCDPELPFCVCGRLPEIRILTKKPVSASQTELAINSRSKPAKLRVAEKSLGITDLEPRMRPFAVHS